MIERLNHQFYDWDPDDFTHAYPDTCKEELLEDSRLIHEEHRAIPFCWGAALMWSSHPLVDGDPNLQCTIDVPVHSFPVFFDSLSSLFYLSCMSFYSLMGQTKCLKSCILQNPRELLLIWKVPSWKIKISFPQTESLTSHRPPKTPRTSHFWLQTLLTHTELRLQPKRSGALKSHI